MARSWRGAGTSFGKELAGSDDAPGGCVGWRRPGPRVLCRDAGGAALFLRMERKREEHSVRRALHLRARAVHAGAWRQLGGWTPVVGSRVSAGGAEPHAHHEGDL